MFSDASRHGRPRPAGTHLVIDDDHSDSDVGRVRTRSAPSQCVWRGHDERPPPPSSALGRRAQRPPPPPPPPPSSSRGRRGRGRSGRHDRRRRRHRPPTPGHGHGSEGTGSVRRTFQAATDQTGRDASRRRQGARQPQTARRRSAVAEHDMSFRVSDVIAQ